MEEKRILQKAQSLCGVCGKPVPGYYAEKNGKVYFYKNCPDHVETEVLAGEDADRFLAWISHPIVNIPPKTALTEGREGECPLHCGTCDQHLQTACCVILDITERCNQHCPCCFADAGKLDKAEGDPTLSEIGRWYDHLFELGEERPFNIQISGGEPTVRDDLPEIIKMAKIKGFEYVQINTNGKRLALEGGYARTLKEAGASVIFLQFDGTREEIHEALRGEPLLEQKKKAIRQCEKAGLPVTLVPTLVADVNLDNVGEMTDFLLENLGVIKGIHFQPMSFFGRHSYDENRQEEQRVTMFRLMEELERQTDGRFRQEDLCPISTGHSLCCFCGTYLRGQNGEIRSLLSDKTKADGVSCCECEDPLTVIRKDRDFVLNKWKAAPPENEIGYRSESRENINCCGSKAPENESCCGSKASESEICCGLKAPAPDGFDEFILHVRRNMFTVSGMAFQDIGNLDAERLKRCRVQVYTKDGRLAPFCAHQIRRGGK